MPTHIYPGLSRRGFLAAGAGAWLAGAARPLLAQATAPDPVLGFDGNHLLVASNHVRRYDLTGNTPQEWPAPGIIHSLATHPDRPGRVVAGFASEGVSISKDGGRSWEPRTTGLTDGTVDTVAIAAGNPDLLYAAVRGDGLWKSEDAGRNWVLAMDRPWLNEAEQDLLTIASVNLETGMGGIWLYAGTEAGLTRVPDCFCRWQDVQPGDALDALVSGEPSPPEAPLPRGEPVRALATTPSAASTLYAALPSGLWTSLDGGVIWSQIGAGAASAIAVHPADVDQLAAIIDGHLKLSRDGGATWVAIAAA